MPLEQVMLEMQAEALQAVPSGCSGFEHAPVVGSQVPAEWQAAPAAQALPAAPQGGGQPSSIWPSQLSSTPLPQISATGAPGVQLAGSQLVPVRAQAPTPHLASGSPSSTSPLQSSSRPLQTSAV